MTAVQENQIDNGIYEEKGIGLIINFLKINIYSLYNFISKKSTLLQNRSLILKHELSLIHD